MNKSELIEQLALKKNIPVQSAEEVVNLIFSSMSEAMVLGERIEIRGLGSFVIKNYGTYTGRNPEKTMRKHQGIRPEVMAVQIAAKAIGLAALMAPIRLRAVATSGIL